jgi:hypothetical protein
MSEEPEGTLVGPAARNISRGRPGTDGSYTVEDVTQQVRALHGTAGSNGAGSQLRKALTATLRVAGVKAKKGPHQRPLQFHLE